MEAQQFFKSGYGLHQSLKREGFEDSFFMDFQFKHACETFQNEWLSWASSIKGQNQILVLDDGSVFSDFLKRLFVVARITAKFIDIRQIQMNQWRLLEENPSVLQRTDLLYACAGEIALQSRSLVICPVFALRIWNINYNRIFKKQYGSPYFVYIESEKFHHLQAWSESLELKIVWNLAYASEGLFQSYFLHPHVQEWLQATSCPEAHNDHLDRILFNDNQRPLSELYQKYSWSQNLEKEYLSQLRPQPLERVHFPIHSFYQKYFEISLLCNQQETKWYGHGI